MNSLAGIDLEDLSWPGELSPYGLEAEVDVTLSGRPVVWERPRQGGRPIDLAGGANTAWLPRATLLALRGLADIPGGVFDLAWDGEIYRVRFRNEDAPAIEAEAVRPGPGIPAAMKYRNIVIKLMEV
ncbi:hypothetical protein G3N56_06215 [Desulfovibrio sulfodismutans]|uniref:Uncharacterized protein n=1 Tax=Desulfolutivibrio sulfodismutans TaxID=63561 RepID=A0A7K3NJP5_9BACT|nr:hypothetical protein [Desulfolutivibrio sulfodismutans]NDY56337.1 hypothetical protein [Desulfolutivibrio sulfodismutans]QLA11524.1 hypothetical protein GD606_04150 [Desulfolutivibrio sulfodismutans DSM 3696]QLA14178.1 hypothetical protein GD606_18855 [Desulfolutivibrio sulfodismutans DSM 3696]